MINILMPMAGEGLRIRNRYSVPKPIIPIKEVPMFCWALESVNIQSNYIFVIKKQHVDEYQINDIIKKYYPDAKIVIQEDRLNGAVFSTMEAKKYITKDPLVIMDCDMYLNLDYKKIIEEEIPYMDAAVGTFFNSSSQYSYVKKDDFGYLINIAEKEVVSNEAVGGSYFWSNGLEYVKYAEQCIDSSGSSELYISSVYKKAIDDNKKIKSFVSKYCFDMGTKDGLDNFMFNRGLL